MNIVIVGAGKVGFNLAKELSISHNVIIIDQNVNALNKIQENIDVMTIEGDAEDSKTYEKFIDKTIDFFIAVTNIDNVNLLSIVIANSILDVKKRFARVQKEFFGIEQLRKKLEIDKLVFPLQLASRSVSNLFDFPKANNVKKFKYTNYKLVSIMVPNDFISQIFDIRVLGIVAIERDKQLIILQETYIEILPNDLIYFFDLEENIKPFSQKLNPNINVELKKCVVFGGDELGISIAQELINKKCDVKIIEKNLNLCEIADEKLGGDASIINAKYGLHDIFINEGIQNADIFIAATSNDEYNIVKSLEAKELGIKKVVAINNEMEHYSLMHLLGITVIRGPKINAYYEIMEDINSSGVILHKFFCGAKGVILMRKIFSNSQLINKIIQPYKNNMAIIFHTRQNNLSLFDKKITLEEDDLITIFCNIEEKANLKRWIHGL